MRWMLVFMILVLMASSVLAAKSPVQERKIDPRVYKMTQFAFPGEDYVLPYPDETIGQAGPHDVEAARQ
ncbi:MAG: hypothetical protein ABIJ12_06715, partial [bacterium]